MLKMSAGFAAHVQAQRQRAHAGVLDIERAANAAPCYHARPHMHCILSNDKSSERKTIHRAYMQTYNVSFVLRQAQRGEGAHKKEREKKGQIWRNY